MKLLSRETIYLRALEPEDLEVVYRWENDASLWAVSNTLEPFSRFVLKLYLERAGEDLVARKQLRMMIVRRSDDVPVGTVELFDVDTIHGRAGLGVCVAEDFRSKGYAKEAVRCLLSYAFEHLHLHQVYCNVGASNTSSLHLFDSLGFARVGEKKEWQKSVGGYESEWLLQLLQKDFMKL